MSAPPVLAAFDPGRLDELVAMWRASFEAGVGVKDPHPIDEQRQFFLDQVLPCNEVRLALAGGEMVGFIAASRESISQLFVRVGFQRRGFGTLLLEWAKSQSGGRLWLYTFQRNHGACAFYERHGFVPVERGFEPLWRLEDIRYEWTAIP